MAIIHLKKASKTPETETDRLARFGDLPRRKRHRAVIFRSNYRPACIWGRNLFR